MKYSVKVLMVYSLFVYAGALCLCGTIAGIVLLNPE